MFRTADMLEIFQQYRGDAIVVPGRGGRHWVSLSPVGTSRWVTQPWVVMRRLLAV